MGRFTESSAPGWVLDACSQLAKALDVQHKEILDLAVSPPKPEMGDLAIPMFAYAKVKKIAPPLIAKEVATKVTGVGYTVAAEGPYVNLRTDRGRLLKEMLSAVHEQGAHFGHLPEDPEKVAVVDYSSPNIAKPLALHHIRSTMIGNAITRILRANGYTVHGFNYLGDWGTSFGYMIAAHENDSKEAFDALTLSDFVKTYISERKKAESDPAVDERARNAFLRLEQGDENARRVWRKARDASLSKFKEVYAMLGVSFEEDMYIGESFFTPMLDAVVEEALTKGLAKEDQGALIVDLAAHGIDTPCLLKKSDGATLYATRDIASAKWRHAKFSGDVKHWRCLYVVDHGQSLHFRQVFKVVEMMGYPWADKLEHIPFGVMLMWSDEDAGWIKGKTRAGNVVLLEDILQEATKRVLKIIDERNPELANKEATAQAIGVGALVFNDLKFKRTNDVKFKFEDALSLEGETGPYVHNALVRTKSILRKAGRAVPKEYDASLLTHAREGEIGVLLSTYSDAVQRAGLDNDPSVIARFLLDLAGAFHAFHHDCLVLDDNNRPLSDARLALTQAVMHVLENAMQLIGLVSIEAM
jgi:arginyl-tRNA synthetase